MTEQTDIIITKAAAGAIIVAPDYGADARKGFDTTTKADYSIPFIKLLQALNPEVDGSKGPDVKIKGAEAGDIMNSVTREITKGLFFVPVERRHSFVEWTPRPTGGFVGEHEPLSKEVTDAKIKNNGSFVGLKSSKGNELKETFTLYGLILEKADSESSFGRYACIAFDSTKIKEYKDMMYRLDSAKVRAPLFANRIKIGSRAQKNAKGNSYNFAITHAIENDMVASLIAPGTTLFQEAKALHEMVRTGVAKADFSKQTAETEGDGAADGKHF